MAKKKLLTLFKQHGAQKELHALLKQYDVKQIIIKSFDYWFRINSVDADIEVHIRNGKMADDMAAYKIQCELAYALESSIRNRYVIGLDIVNIMPDDIVLMNAYGLDLRSQSGLVYEFPVNDNDGS